MSANPWFKEKQNKFGNSEYNDMLQLCKSYNKTCYAEENFIKFEGLCEDIKLNILSFNKTFKTSMPIILETIKQDTFTEPNDELSCIISDQNSILSHCELFMEIFNKLNFIEYNEQFKDTFNEYASKYLILIDKISNFINDFVTFIKEFHKCNAGLVLSKYIFNDYTILENIINECTIKSDIITGIIKPIKQTITRKETIPRKHNSVPNISDIQLCFSYEDYDYLCNNDGFIDFGFNIYACQQIISNLKTLQNKKHIKMLPESYKIVKCACTKFIKGTICSYHYSCTFLHLYDNITFNNDDLNFVKKAIYWLISIIAKLYGNYNNVETLEKIKNLVLSCFIDNSEGYLWINEVFKYYCPPSIKTKLVLSYNKTERQAKTFNNQNNIFGCLGQSKCLDCKKSVCECQEELEEPNKDELYDSSWDD